VFGGGFGGYDAKRFWETQQTEAKTDGAGAIGVGFKRRGGWGVHKGEPLVGGNHRSKNPQGEQGGGGWGGGTWGGKKVYRPQMTTEEQLEKQPWFSGEGREAREVGKRVGCANRHPRGGE